MSLAVAGLAGAGVDVIDADCAVVSYPGLLEARPRGRRLGDGVDEGVDPA